MTKDEFNKALNEVLESDDVKEVISAMNKKGMPGKLTLWAFAQHIAERVCEND